MRTPLPLVMTALLAAVVPLGCRSRTPPPFVTARPLPQWNTPRRAGVLRVVFSERSDQGPIAVKRLEQSGKAAYRVGDKLRAELKQRRAKMLPGAAEADWDTLVKTACDAVAAGARPKLVEISKTHEAQGGAAIEVASGLFEVERSDITRAVTDAVRPLAQKKGWDVEPLVKGLDDAVRAMPDDG